VLSINQSAVVTLCLCAMSPWQNYRTWWWVLRTKVQLTQIF